jgi:transcription antitermination factor NusG
LTVHWLGVHTKVASEKRARRELANQGFTVYLPLVQTGRIRTDPLFPRHLFVRYTPSWGPIRSTKGVSDVLMTGELPSLMPHKFIRKMKSCHDRDGIIKLPLWLDIPEPTPAPTPKAFTPGQTVQIKDDHYFLGGEFVIFKDMKSSDRAIILSRIFDSVRESEIDLDFLKAA